MNALATKVKTSCCRITDWFERVRKAMELAPYIDDLYEAFEERESDTKLTPGERELLENTLAFGEITADEISVPRADIVGVPEKADLKKVMKAFKESHHNRLLVFGRSLDDIKGLIALKDMLPVLEKPETFDLKAMLRPVPFVQESMPLPKVLQVMKKNGTPLVLVTDEFGGTSGLISLKDIVEELVGDIDDDREPDDVAPFVSIGANRYRVRGDCLLEDFDAAQGTSLAQKFEDYAETIGGAVMQVAKTVPAKGERVTLMDGVEGTVVASDGRRVVAVDLKLTV